MDVLEERKTLDQALADLQSEGQALLDAMVE